MTALRLAEAEVRRAASSYARCALDAAETRAAAFGDPALESAALAIEIAAMRSAADFLERRLERERTHPSPGAHPPSGLRPPSPTNGGKEV
jgi:hypothetical protein